MVLQFDIPLLILLHLHLMKQSPDQPHTDYISWGNQAGTQQQKKGNLAVFYIMNWLQQDLTWY